MTDHALQRTLAIDVAWNGFWFVVLEGSERLLDWGLVDIYRHKDERLFLARVARLVDEHQPSAIVVESVAGSRRGELARRRLAAVGRFARRRGIALHRVARKEVGEGFADSGRYKHEIALAIARLFPELEAWLPRKPKAWEKENARLGIFNAASLALVALRRQEDSGK